MEEGALKPEEKRGGPEEGKKRKKKELSLEEVLNRPAAETPGATVGRSRSQVWGQICSFLLLS